MWSLDYIIYHCSEYENIILVSCHRLREILFYKSRDYFRCTVLQTILLCISLRDKAACFVKNKQLYKAPGVR